MNGRTQRAIDLCTSVAFTLAFATFAGSQGSDFDCNVAKCFFGVKYEEVKQLVENFSFGIMPSNSSNICSQTAFTLIMASELPSSCGSDYNELRSYLSSLCQTSLHAHPASCGSAPDDVTSYLVTYVVLYSFLLILNVPLNGRTY